LPVGGDAGRMASDTSDATTGDPAAGESASLLAGRRVGPREGLFWLATALTVGAVAASVGTGVKDANAVPPAVYVFGFLGAMVYAFTSLAEEFDGEHYGYKLLSRSVAALPLAAGVYLLSFGFDATSSGSSPEVGQVTAGLTFLAGLFVSMTLKSLGSLAERLLGVDRGSDDAET